MKQRVCQAAAAFCPRAVRASEREPRRRRFCGFVIVGVELDGTIICKRPARGTQRQLLFYAEALWQNIVPAKRPVREMHRCSDTFGTARNADNQPADDAVAALA